MDIQVPTGSSSITAYSARPRRAAAGGPPWPGVVVIHDISGPNHDLRSITDRVAAAGYLCLAPDLYCRGGRAHCLTSVFRALLAGRGQAHEDIDAARHYLAAQPECTGKVGVIGFCMGGGFALVAAAGGFDASAPFYGMLPRDRSVLQAACPVVASFGRRDPSLIGAGDKLRRTLRDNQIPHDVKTYPKAGHSFANRLPLGPLQGLARIAGFGYHEESAEDAWRRVFGFFETHLR
ncbi:MAG: dienelactone hydrolase family protein [Sciscionella sp.]